VKYELLRRGLVAAARAIGRVGLRIGEPDMLLGRDTFTFGPVELPKGTIVTLERPGYIVTYPGGRRFWPMEPNRDDIDILDIAHALSQICRYNGHVSAPLSVAQHCVIVSEAVPPADAPWALLHDASEAYLCDLVRPVKYLRELARYRAAEARLEALIFERFGLHGPCPPSVKRADDVVLKTEQRDLTKNPGWMGHEVLPGQIVPWPAAEARERFLTRFNELFPAWRLSA